MLPAAADGVVVHAKKGRATWYRTYPQSSKRVRRRQRVFLRAHRESRAAPRSLTCVQFFDTPCHITEQPRSSASSFDLLSIRLPPRAVYLDRCTHWEICVCVCAGRGHFPRPLAAFCVSVWFVTAIRLTCRPYMHALPFNNPCLSTVRFST